MREMKLWRPLTPFLSGDWPNWPLSDNWDVSFEDNELDMYETDNTVVVEVKCPGFTADDIEVSLEGGILSIKGKMKDETEEEEKKKKYYRKEIKQKSFARSITLPVSVKTDEVKAKFTDGMLKLTLPKAEESKPKQIRINVN